MTPLDPLAARYASREMAAIFSPQFKYSTWRRLWLALARAEKTLGLPITDAQIKELAAHVDQIDFAAAARLEKSLRHDVMAHIAVYGEACPQAKGVIHLGATSAYVTDNTDLIQIRAAFQLLKVRLAKFIQILASLAEKYADLPTLSYTHLQPAQPTTVGKRLCLWLQDFLIDLRELLSRETSIAFLGVKGATGTQASFLSLFGGDRAKVTALDELVAKEMGFKRILLITSQTYPRKEDQRFISMLTGLGCSAHKCATDLRILSYMQEVEEPFEERQIGSSAMPHKRNPIRSERICGLSRYLISLSENPAYNAATQWLERSLDDSANRRLVIPQVFMTADAIVNLLQNVFSGLTVYPQAIAAHLKKELPFLALEAILMQAVKKGGDRQQLHERLRQHSLAASARMKEGGEIDLLERLTKDSSLHLSQEELSSCMDAGQFIGCAPEQVRRFLQEEVSPLLATLGPLTPPQVSIEV